jgi:ribose transport system permease protein
MTRTITLLLITGFAMMAAIGMGAFDLSVGSTAGLAAITCASGFVHGLGFVASVAVALLVGMTCGAINGALVAGIGITPFVVTLGTFSAFEGISLLYTGGSSILVSNAAFEAFGRAAQAVGLPVRMTRFAVFVIIGLSAALAGIVEAATLLNVSPALGQDNYNLLTIAVVVIGGTSLRGGDVTVLGTVFGAMLIVFVQAGLQVMGLSPLLDGLVVGAVLIAALFLAAMRDRMQYRLIFGSRRTQRLT